MEPDEARQTTFSGTPLHIPYLPFALWCSSPHRASVVPLPAAACQKHMWIFFYEEEPNS